MMEDQKDNIAEVWGLAMQEVGEAADSFAEKN